ncbi:conjugal transfer protein TraJ [Lampropedia aestuarii]|uniref:Conjugal transfer protein TraJ n=1 Tax=Lampropedia aestuarii TaxID=2562762 RepID=A0A4S5BH21_9BURK|nr:conjugal transfer protein TraJ [Lampropedia aestuarii]THJ31667.1 conjugal transfer protein TraJ [Lampropedia aestuarii]
MDESDLAGTRRREGRPRSHRIEVWVTQDEKATIAQSAVNAGMKESAFLRALGLNVRVRSVLDLEAATELSKVNGDLGRVAGLLKLWLAEKRGVGDAPAAVGSMMDDFRMLQKQMRDLIHVAIRGRK